MPRPLTFDGHGVEAVLPWREFLRRHCPHPKEGFVVEDVDLLVRGYGPKFHTDRTGKFFLIEIKYGRAWPGLAQLYTFGLIDSLLQLADPDRKRYLGFYVLQYDDVDWEVARFRLNGREVDREGLRAFFEFRRDEAPYTFPNLN